MLSGFPWLSLGYAMIDSPLQGWAPLFGVYGVTWAAVTIAAALNVLLMPAVSTAAAGWPRWAPSPLRSSFRDCSRATLGRAP